jgi:hypothetical protein
MSCQVILHAEKKMKQGERDKELVGEGGCCFIFDKCDSEQSQLSGFPEEGEVRQRTTWFSKKKARSAK